MCSEYEIRATKKDIDDSLGISIKTELPQLSWDIRVKMSMKAPIILLGNNDPVLVEKIFPVMPFPNARMSGFDERFPASGDHPLIRKVFELPTWKKGFEFNPCVIPFTAFFEPVYWGPMKGKVARFESKRNIMFAAGILVEPKKPIAGTLDGFAILTSVANEFMLQLHHRLVKIISPEAVLPYLNSRGSNQRFDLLSQLTAEQELDVTVDRQMAKGWEKRVAEHEEKLQSELKFRKFAII